MLNEQLLGHTFEVALAHAAETVADVLLDQLVCVSGEGGKVGRCLGGRRQVAWCCIRGSLLLGD